jgi:predicted DNA-binding transcriptional regulator YafY
LKQNCRKALRLLRLILLFREGGRYTSFQVATFLQVAPCTARRYLAELQGEEMRFPLCSDERGIWWLMEL